MGISVFPAASGGTEPDWKLVATATPTNVNTLNFSGLSGYNRYRLVMPAWYHTYGSRTLNIRFNSDTTSTAYQMWGHYLYFTTAAIIENVLFYGNTAFIIDAQDNVQQSATIFEISNANAVGMPKVIAGDNMLYKQSNRIYHQRISGT